MYLGRAMDVLVDVPCRGGRQCRHLRIQQFGGPRLPRLCRGGEQRGGAGEQGSGVACICTARTTDRQSLSPKISPIAAANDAGTVAG